MTLDQTLSSFPQIKTVKIRESKFGLALVLETTSQSGGYVLGFKIDPKETLDYVFKEINSLWQVYAKAPIYGVEYVVSPDAPPLSSFKISSEEEDVQIGDAEDRGDMLATYYADSSKGQDRSAWALTRGGASPILNNAVCAQGADLQRRAWPLR